MIGIDPREIAETRHATDGRFVIFSSAGALPGWPLRSGAWWPIPGATATACSSGSTAWWPATGGPCRTAFVPRS
jgi:hypothetical protein